MNINACAINLLGYYAPEERSIPDNITYPGRNAAVMKAMNHAAQELFGKGKAWVRHDERGAVLYAPTPVTIALVTGSTAGTVTGWVAWMTGCTVVIDGMDIDNQIRNASATIRLKYPYSGATGTHTATVYHDSVEVATDVAEIHEPVRLNGRKMNPMPTPYPLAGGASIKDFRFHQHEPLVTSISIATTAATPTSYAIDAWSPDDATAPVLRLRVFPAPDRQYFLEYPVMQRPPVITDLASTSGLPIPFDKVESIYLPLAVAALRKSPFWRGIVGEETVAAGRQEALDALKEANPKKSTGARFVPIF